MASSSSLTPHRNRGIDVLRGVSILLVVLHHLGLRIPLKRTVLAYVLPAPVLRALNFNGYEAVFVFFVVSGFLIAGNVLRRHGSLHPMDVRAFYTRRAARILPCLLVLLAVLSTLHVLDVEDYHIHREGQSLGGALAAALGLYLNRYEGMTGYLPGNWDVLWSLSIEEVFYLGFPLLCLLTRRDVILLPLLLVLAVSLPWTHAALAGNEIWQEKAYLPGMAAIAVGVLGAWLQQRFRLTRRIAITLAVTGTAILLAVFVDGAWVWHLLHDGYLLLLCLGTLALLLACSASSAPRTSSWRGMTWLRRWGQLSYEIYLSHMFVVYAVVRASKAFGGDLVWYLVALPCCWWLGRTIQRVLSIPAERWLAQRLRPRSVAVTVAAEQA